jgi:hypothetical protein
MMPSFLQIPLLDFPGTPIGGGIFALMLWLQWKRPLRHQRFPALRRVVRNMVFAAPAFVVLRLALLPIPLAAAAWAARHKSFPNENYRTQHSFCASL